MSLLSSVTRHGRLRIVFWLIVVIFLIELLIFVAID